MEQPIRSFVSQLGRGLPGILSACRWKGGTFHSSNGISRKKSYRIPVTKLQVHFRLMSSFSDLPCIKIYQWRESEKKFVSRKYQMPCQNIHIFCVFLELRLKVQQVLGPVSVDFTCPRCSRIFHRHKERRHKQTFQTSTLQNNQRRGGLRHFCRWWRKFRSWKIRIFHFTSLRWTNIVYFKTVTYVEKSVLVYLCFQYFRFWWNSGWVRIQQRMTSTVSRIRWVKRNLSCGCCWILWTITSTKFMFG